MQLAPNGVPAFMTVSKVGKMAAVERGRFRVVSQFEI
jgi:hypothetical protein